MKEQRRKENHSLCGFYVRVYCEVQMNLFRLFYENPRAEIPEDAPPKTGAALLFEIVRRDGWDICKMAALCLLTCIPIVTIPAACVFCRTYRATRGLIFAMGGKAAGKKHCPLLFSF